jgi:hypothetical protein
MKNIWRDERLPAQDRFYFRDRNAMLLAFRDIAAVPIEFDAFKP